MAASDVATDRAFYDAVAKSFNETVTSIPVQERRFFSTQPDEERLRDILPPDSDASTGDIIDVTRKLKKAKIKEKKRTSYADLFVRSFPGEDRQSINCCYCKRFIDRYGSLVTVDDRTGMTKSLMWQAPLDDVPDMYKPAVSLLKQAVEYAGVITDQYGREDEMTVSAWGTGMTTKKGDWYHLLINSPLPSFTARRHDLDEVEMQLIRDALVLFPAVVVDAAALLLRDVTDSTARIQRPDVFEATIDWFADVTKKYALFTSSLGSVDDETKDRLVRNLMWSLIAQAPGPSFTHLKNNITGELLEAIKEFTNKETEFLDKAAVVNRINGQMTTYREQTTGPNEQQLKACKDFLSKSKLDQALEKVFALPEDIPHAVIIWKANHPEKVVIEETKNEKPIDAVSQAISQVKAVVRAGKKKAPAQEAKEIQVTRGAISMSWKTFNETILPDTESIEVKWPSESDEKLFTILKSKNDDATVMHKWGNNFNWTFKRGGLVPGETRKRVRQAGGTVDECPVRCSLIWNTFDDLDLDVITPAGERVFYSHRKSKCGGELDTDANGMDKRTETPVENTRWFKTAPLGTYLVKVIAYAYHTNSNEPVDFNVEIEVDGVRYTYEGCAGHGGRNHGEEIKVATIDYRPNGVGSSKVIGKLPEANSPIWSIERGSWQDVREVFPLPNSWPANPDAKVEKCSLPQLIGFSVRGCQNVKEARAWHIETLISECRLHERSLQAIGKTIGISRKEDGRKMCGVGENFDAPSDWDTCLRVRKKGETKTTVYQIDRPE